VNPVRLNTADGRKVITALSDEERQVVQIG
jgi:hypothetical protein